MEQTGSAIEELYRDAFPRFLRVTTAIVGDRGLGLDAVQEGFALALKDRRRHRGDGPLEAWVWRIVVNEALKSRWRRLAELPVERTEGSSNGHGDEDRELRATIALLPERQRLAVFLRYYADLDYAAIAEALGIQVGTVSATLSSAHAALRRTLQEVER